jgi:DinB superfamily
MADVSFDEVLPVRSGRQQQVREIVDGLTDDELGRAGGATAAPGFPPGATFPVSQCLDVVIAEEWAHHDYATRDLAFLEIRHPDST